MLCLFPAKYEYCSSKDLSWIVYYYLIKNGAAATCDLIEVGGHRRKWPLAKRQPSYRGRASQRHGYEAFAAGWQLANCGKAASLEMVRNSL